MRVASNKTLTNSKSTRFNYAYRAIERASLSEDIELQKKGDAAMEKLALLSKDEMLHWALREQEFKLLTE